MMTPTLTSIVLTRLYLDGGLEGVYDDGALGSSSGFHLI